MREKAKEDFGRYHDLVMEAVRSLHKHLMPEAVICFGCVAANERRAVCNILVLAGGYEENSLGDIVMLFPRDFIQNFECGIRVNWLLHSVASLTRLIQFKHPFYNNIALNGILLYRGNTRTSLPKPRAKWASTKNDEHWAGCISYGRDFLALAELALSANLYKMTDYNLYMAVEWCGKAVLQRYMGYKQTTSNINRLFELLHMVSPEFSKVVAASYPTDKETWAIGRLREAYEKIGDTDIYHSSKDSAIDLTHVVKKVFSIAMRLEDSETIAFDDMA